jgi:poly-gamma-glutamate synthesis protein (capsule biosynthesis protein)
VVNTGSFADELVFESVVALCRFGEGRVSEIRLYPVDLGYGRRLTESGVPRAASEEVGRRILQRLQRLSRPYGTTIVLEGNVGIIRPATETLGRVGVVP